ncbi:MAG: hypothetical protein VX910_13460 [Candidatus Latescibacterota bacterium]|nr:hypothetical protein [Candidatus Latescibacterota bacterium]
MKVAAIFISILLVWSSIYTQPYVANGIKIGEVTAKSAAGGVSASRCGWGRGKREVQRAE